METERACGMHSLGWLETYTSIIYDHLRGNSVLRMLYVLCIYIYMHLCTFGQPYAFGVCNMSGLQDEHCLRARVYVCVCVRVCVCVQMCTIVIKLSFLEMLPVRVFP